MFRISFLTVVQVKLTEGKGQVRVTGSKGYMAVACQAVLP